jgi:hypothetical protein
VQVCARHWARCCQLMPQGWARPSHILLGIGLTPATSAPGLGAPLLRIPRHWARRCPHRRRDWATLASPAAGGYMPVRTYSTVRHGIPYPYADHSGSCRPRRSEIGGFRAGTGRRGDTRVGSVHQGAD